MSASPVRCLNPVTGSIHSLRAIEPAVSSLQDACICAIRRTATIYNLEQLRNDAVPQQLHHALTHLCLQDFYINPETVLPEHQSSGHFPATCLIDQTPVILALSRSGEVQATDDPALMATFECNENICCVLAPTISLADKVSQAHEANLHHPESFIWELAHQLSIQLPSIPADSVIEPKHIHFMRNKTIIRAPAIDDAGNMAQMADAVAFYQAPEGLMGQAINPEQGNVWTIGCLLYETMALEPAFYDRESSGNIMAVMMGMTQGEKPPEVTGGSYSQVLKDTIMKCLNHIPEERLELQAIVNLAETRLNMS